MKKMKCSASVVKQGWKQVQAYVVSQLADGLWCKMSNILDKFMKNVK